MTPRTPVSTALFALSIVLAGTAGCAPQSTPSAAVATPTVAPGWERFAHPGPCGYVIDFPADMDSAQQGAYSLIVSPAAREPGGLAPNFVYVSVIPPDAPTGEGEIIYNYDPVEARTLLDMQIGESRSLREDPNLASWFRYTRLSDTAFGLEAARAYENEQPWEFPPGTKEIRYYLQAPGCTYLLGGYMATVGSGQPGWFDEERFDQIMATFRLAP